MRSLPLALGALLCLLLCSCQTETTPVTQASPRLNLSLDQGWLFHAGEANGAADVAEPGPGWTSQNLPHTWNALDGQDGGDNYRRGAGWYRLHLRPDASLAGRCLFLQFDGAFLKTDVYVNGKPVGSHTGGFARFRMDVSKVLIPGADNLIAVRVDNSRMPAPPVSADFSFFGGLYRHVSLLATEPLHVETMDHASPGIYLSQRSLDATKAEVACRVLVSNQATEDSQAELRARVLDAQGNQVAAATAPLALKASASGEASLPLHIERPHRWDGVRDPYLYQVVVEVWSKGRLCDTLNQPLGLRTVQFDPEKGLLLNGTPYRLNGVNRHQDRPNKGWAISEADEAEDFALIREMGANAVRTAHYQQAESWYERCDKAGMAVWTEIPYVNEPIAGPEFAANAAQQLRELIRQNFNHPSIFVWGISNELNDASGIPLLRELATLEKSEDPGRPSTYACNQAMEDERNTISEVTGFNRYFGWYSGECADFGPFLDKAHSLHPKQAFAVSEYGAGAGVHTQEQNPPRRKTTDRLHPEQYQSHFHEAVWPLLRDRDYLWGTFIWVMFDFASDGRHEGELDGINDKGLVTADRQTRKDAFYYYKAQWSKEPVLHLTSSRHEHRTAEGMEVKVYSNATMVELFINGRSLGLQAGEDHVFLWKNILLTRGANEVEVQAWIDGKQLKDKAVWYYQPTSR
jgi:beta-galactosidase